MLSLYFYLGCTTPEPPPPFNQGDGQVYDAGSPIGDSTESTEEIEDTDDSGEEDSGSEDDSGTTETGED